MWFTTEDVLLQPDMEVYTVDVAKVFVAWSQLCEVSVEIAAARHPHLFDFAANHCLYFAVIQRWIPQAEREEDDEAQAEEEKPLETERLDAMAQGPSSSATTARWPFNMAREPTLSAEDAAQQLEHELKLSDIWSAHDDDLPRPSPAKHSSDGASTSPGTFPQQTIGLLYMCSGRMAQEMSLGLTILPEFRGRGYATQAATLALRWAFDELQCHRVQALIMEGAHADDTAHLFARLGFAPEGTLRRAALSENSWRDVTAVAMLDTEWCVGVQRRAVQSRWDVLLARHQREVEQLLAWEEKMSNEKGKGKLKRTASMETVKDAMVDISCPSASESEDTDMETDMETDDGARSPFSYCSAASSPRSLSRGRLPMELPSARPDSPLEYWDPPPRPLPTPAAGLGIVAGETPHEAEETCESDWELASTISEPDCPSDVSIPDDDGSVFEPERSPSAASMCSWSDLETSSVESAAETRWVSNPGALSFIV